MGFLDPLSPSHMRTTPTNIDSMVGKKKTKKAVEYIEKQFKNKHGKIEFKSICNFLLECENKTAASIFKEWFSNGESIKPKVIAGLWLTIPDYANDRADIIEIINGSIGSNPQWTLDTLKDTPLEVSVRLLEIIKNNSAAKALQEDPKFAAYILHRLNIYQSNRTPNELKDCTDSQAVIDKIKAEKAKHIEIMMRQLDAHIYDRAPNPHFWDDLEPPPETKKEQNQDDHGKKEDDENKDENKKGDHK